MSARLSRKPSGLLEPDTLPGPVLLQKGELTTTLDVGVEFTRSIHDTVAPGLLSNDQKLAGTMKLAEPEVSRSEPKYLPPVRIPVVRSYAPPFQLLQLWEGVVVSVGEGEFTAELEDLGDLSQPRESATFSTEEVSESDTPLVKPGAVFYWYIGYRFAEGGQKERVSALRFRRLPAWTASELRAARKKAAALIESLGTQD